MAREEIPDERGLDWVDHGTTASPNVGSVKWNSGSHLGSDVVYRLPMSSMAAAEQSVSDVEKKFNSVLDRSTDERLSGNLPHDPLRSAYIALKPLIAEGRVPISLTSCSSLDGAKKEDASTDHAIQLAHEVRRETQAGWNAQCDKNDDEEQVLLRRTDQEVTEKIASLKGFGQEFGWDRLGAEESNNEEREDDPEAVKPLKSFYKDYCREKSDAAKGIARQLKYIAAPQRPWGTSEKDEAPRSPSPSR